MNTLLALPDGSQMNAYDVAQTGLTTHTKGIILLQEAFGVNDYIRRMADRFAAQGYLAIAPELFHRTHPGFDADYEKREGVSEAMSALTEEGQKADVQAAYDWLTSQGVAPTKVVAIGFCMGGRAAYLANASLPLAASASFYGGGIASLLNARPADLHGPQLLIWGGQDANIPAEQRRAIADALKEAGKPFVEATWSEAGHGFACDARSAYHAPSAREALALTDAFFGQVLGENAA